MKKTLSLFLTLAFCFTAHAAAGNDDHCTQCCCNGLDDVVYTAADSIRIESVLKEAETMGEGTNPTVYFARKFKGVPYVAHTLETDGEERLVVNTRELDCLTLVETATALTLCHERKLKTFADYCSVLRMMRYRNGVIDGYPSRIHYFSEWINESEEKGFAENITSEVIPFTAQGKVDVWFMGTYPDKYKKLKGRTEDIELIRSMEKKVSGETFRYIPKNEIKNTRAVRRAVHNGDILAIVTSMKGLDIAHVGIAVWHRDGLHLLNASSIHHKVVEEPMTLYQYMQKHKSQKGIRVVRLKH